MISEELPDTKTDLGNNKSLDFILNKIKASGIEVITDNDKFNEILDYINEFNITLEM